MGGIVGRVKSRAAAARFLRYREGMEARVCRHCRELQKRLATLQAENQRLPQLLDDARRQGKRQAAPFPQGTPNPVGCKYWDDDVG